MSLKAFHLFFVFIATVLCAGFGGWSIGEYRAFGNTTYLYLAIGSMVVTVALVIYFPWCVKKLKEMSYLLLALSLAGTSDAMACATCFGDPNSPMVKGVNSGILFLLGLITFIVVVCWGLFIYWQLRAKRLALT